MKNQPIQMEIIENLKKCMQYKKIKYHKRRYTTVITLCYNLTVTTSYFFNCMLKISSKDEMVTSISSKLYIYGSTSSLAKFVFLMRKLA